MKATSYSLIIVPPQSPQMNWVHISRRTLVVLAAAFLLSFLATIALLLTYPKIRVNEMDGSRLAAENQALKIENQNIAFRTQRLASQLNQMEAVSKRVTDLMAE